MPVDFGVSLPTFPPDGDPDIIGHYCRWVDALSPEFTTLWVSDHMQFGDSPVMESWTRLTYLAALFPHLKVGHLVLGQGYRNPALLAKMGATLQQLSSGRFILGIGAGWHEEEYRAYGYDFPSPGTRVAQLDEAIQIIRALWTESPATFHGKHYTIDNAYCEPKPEPLPPIMIGSNGPKVLRITARLADGWSWDAPMDVYGRPHAELLRACAEVGRDPATIWLTSSVDVTFPDDPSTFVATYEHSYYPGQQFAYVGPTPDAAIEQLRPMVEVGVRHFIINPDSLRTLERFAAEVAPVLARLGASVGAGNSA